MNNARAGSPITSARRKIATLVAAGALLSAAPLAAMAATPSNAEGPTAQNFMALSSTGSQSDWILPAGNYSGNRFLKEDQITSTNVGQLQTAWTFTIPDDAPIETSPIMWNGMVYITSAHDDVYALDAKTGKLEWTFADHPTQIVGFSRNRGVAVLDGKVFIATIGGHLVALDAKTGKKVWDKLEVKDPKTSFYTMQPVPYQHELLLGVSNGDWGGIGNISAFSAENGDRLWEWDTIPKPGQPGNDTWSGDSWKRGGASVWSGIAIDPATHTLYADLGNPGPDFLSTFRKGDNLYSDSMVALDISGKTPKLKWYHQFIAHDTHDWDPAMPPVLFTGKVDGKEMKLAAAGDKAGNFWILNATTGALVHHTAVSFQHNQNSAPSLQGNIACPSTNGGVEYNGGAYDPTTNTFFVPSANQCAAWKGNAKPVYIAGQFYLGGAFPKLTGPNWGWFNAVDVNSGVFSWRHYFGLPVDGGALVLSNGSTSVVFTGELGGNFDAFDGATGKLLWHADTGASIAAPPATYMDDGARYVVVASGQAGFLQVPEMTKKMGPAVLTAFTLKPDSVTH
ncbi:MAG: pyrroloquinoline quinone-dependent dehydrogenase [Acetobacteraceae bacterium]